MNHVLITIDQASTLPLFEQLATDIRVSIMNGTLEFGERLPAARELAQSLDINVHTVLRSYQVLRDEGFLELRRGRGAVVAGRARDYTQLAKDIERLVAESKRLQLTHSAVAALIRKAYE